MIRHHIGIGILVSAVGLVAGLVLAAWPQSYTNPAHPHQKVRCGNAFTPKNPPPPPGTHDECDAAHVKQAGLIVIVVLGGLLAGGAISFILHPRYPQPHVRIRE